MRLLRSARWLLLALLISFVPVSSYAGVFISVSFGPPVLPVYVQPVCPGPDLVWTPGYWAYGDMGYYWVPGAWVPAPFVGGLWTPGYWGWNNGLYVYNPGYWGYHVGYYGGVNYGGGYLGIGFAGGEWRGGHMAYNTAVVNVNTTVIHNTYINKTVIEQTTVVNNNHVAYSGGPGGVQHTANAQEQIAANETHTPPTSFQAQHQSTAQQDKSSWAKTNGGHPATLAVAKPLPVESHPAPPKPAMASTVGKTTATPSKGITPQDSASGLSSGKRASAATPEANQPKPVQCCNTATHPAAAEPARIGSQPSKPANAPKAATAAPRSSPPPPKPKPEGHEK